MEEAPEDAGGSSSLFQLCARAVTANMERLEEEVWGLPAVILQGLLPLLNIYYLERIEPAAARKGLSTQSIWSKIWNDVMKNKPQRLMTVTCWRKKFLETFFHSVLRGTLDVSSDWRLNDRRFSPLVHSSRHVSELTIFGKQQGVLDLNPAVLERLAQSVESLKFLHIRLSDAGTQRRLRSLLHHLIHHGRVSKVSVLSWPRPDKELLLLILKISAGYWQEDAQHPCALCAYPATDSAYPATDSAYPATDSALYDHPTTDSALYTFPATDSAHPATGSAYPATDSAYPATDSALYTYPATDSAYPSTNSALYDHPATDFAHPATGSALCADSQEEPGCQSALLSLQPLNISQSAPPERGGAPGEKSAPPERGGAPGEESAPSERGGACGDGGEGSAPPLPSAETSSTSSDGTSGETSEAGDLYDLIFSVPPEGEGHTQDEDTPLGEPLLPNAIRLRSVRALNLHNVFLTPNTCQCLCQLLRSWGALERLTMAYNDLQRNVVMVMEALGALSRLPGCSLSSVSLSDFSTYVAILDLAQSLLLTFPRLQSLLLCYDLEETPDKVLLEAGPAEFTGNGLKSLDLRFPQNSVDSGRLVSALKASPDLLELSLDNAVLTRQQDVRLLLQTITEHNRSLRRLGFHDLNLIDSQPEILNLLRHPSLEEMKLSFCRVFERSPGDFLSSFVGALKENSTLKILKLGGNRLGNKGFCSLVDLYAADSSSSIHCLDVSSNGITSAGLLLFAQRLDALGAVKLRNLRVTQNALDLDAVMTRDALQTLEGTCHVIRDSWDPSHSLADHLSVM